MKRWHAEFAKKYGNAGICSIDCEYPAQEALPRLKRFFQTPATLFSGTQLAILKHFFSCKQEDIQHLVVEMLPALQGSQFLVIHDGKIDGRSALYKTFLALQKNGHLQREEYAIPTGATLEKWIVATCTELGGRFEREAVTALCRIADPPEREALKEDVSYNLWQLSGEIQKCIAFAHGRAVTRKDIELLVSQNPWGHVFTLTDAILAQDRTHVARLSRGAFGTTASSKLKSETIRMVSALGTQFRSFLILKSLLETTSQRGVAEKLSWNEKRVWVVTRKLQEVSIDRLKHIYSVLLECDFKMKVSRMDPQIDFDLLLERMMA